MSYIKGISYLSNGSDLITRKQAVDAICDALGDSICEQKAIKILSFLPPVRQDNKFDMDKLVHILIDKCKSIDNQDVISGLAIAIAEISTMRFSPEIQEDE